MAEKHTAPELVVAKKKDLELVLELIRGFHQSEGLELSSSKLTNTVYPLLRKQNELGCIFIIMLKGEAIGYIALCFGYSIEFGGRDAFIDEFFIKKEFRGKKLGKAVLEQCKLIAKQQGANALHIEARSDAEKLQKMYADCGFTTRDQYQLMSSGLNQ